MDTKTIRLTEKESIILRDICFARMKVLHAGEAATIEELPMQCELTETTARMALPAFDFFRCAYFGNEEGLKRQAIAQRSPGPHAGGEYYDGMIGDYQKIMAGLMGDKYSPVDVETLQNRLKGFVKSLKAASPRTLYIADCHFYHNRICKEMDKRGFIDFKEMNDHMVRQWNR